jgi:hypothetical protein
MIDLAVAGIILTINQKGLFLGIIRIFEVKKSWSLVLIPLVHGACFLVDFRAAPPKMGIFSVSYFEVQHMP